MSMLSEMPRVWTTDSHHDSIEGSHVDTHRRETFLLRPVPGYFQTGIVEAVLI